MDFITSPKSCVRPKIRTTKTPKAHSISPTSTRNHLTSLPTTVRREQASGRGRGSSDGGRGAAAAPGLRRQGGRVPAVPSAVPGPVGRAVPRAAAVAPARRAAAALAALPGTSAAAGKDTHCYNNNR